MGDTRLLSSPAPRVRDCPCLLPTELTKTTQECKINSLAAFFLIQKAFFPARFHGYYICLQDSCKECRYLQDPPRSVLKARMLQGLLFYIFSQPFHFSGFFLIFVISSES